MEVVGTVSTWKNSKTVKSTDDIPMIPYFTNDTYDTL